VEGIAKLIDLAVEALQILSIFFLAYGASLAIRETDGATASDSSGPVCRSGGSKLQQHPGGRD
jgi:hypothetical protein